MSGSSPTSRACKSWPSAVVTATRAPAPAAPATWLLVRIRPSGATMTPEPVPPRVFVGAYGEPDHGGADAIDDVDDRTRIGVQERLILGRNGKLGGCGGLTSAQAGVTQGIIFTEFRLVWPASQIWPRAGEHIWEFPPGRERAAIAAAVDSVARLWCGRCVGAGLICRSCRACRRDIGTSIQRARKSEGDFMAIVNAARPAAALVVAAAFLALAGCDQSDKQASAPPPPAVTVTKPVARTVVDQDEYVGRFVAIDSVEVRSRVSGYLSEIHFTDGQMVKKGDLLFIIDHRPFQIALDQMRANLAQARANLAFTEADLARGQELVRNRTITEQTSTSAPRPKASRRPPSGAQEAMVHQAEARPQRIPELRAPIDGRIGDRRVSVGNLVTGGNGSNTTLLATIVSVDPIRFEFTFDEASYLRYQRFAGTDAQMASGEGGVSVTLKLIDEPRLRTHRPHGFRRQRHRPLDRARSAAARCSPIRMACSRPACSAASGCRDRRRTRRC